MQVDPPRRCLGDRIAYKFVICSAEAKMDIPAAFGAAVPFDYIR